LVNTIASKVAHKSFTGFDGVFKNAEVIGQILSDEIVISEKEIKDLPNLLVQDRFCNTLAQVDQSKTLVFVS
jgi:hypothetical protein